MNIEKLKIKHNNSPFCFLHFAFFYIFVQEIM